MYSKWKQEIQTAFAVEKSEEVLSTGGNTKCSCDHRCYSIRAQVLPVELSIFTFMQTMT
jgi:hypothetical protein